MTIETRNNSAQNIPSYPMTVLRGCASIDEVAEFKDLPDGFIRVVMRLIKKIDVMTPEKPIFARRDTLAREAGKSCETVGRALKWLEQHGFITRIQVTRKFLKGSDSHIHPTSKLISSLGFGKNIENINNNKSSAISTFNIKQPPVKNDGSLSALHKNINIHKQSNEPVDKSLCDKSVISKCLSVKIQGKTIPRDLSWLVHQGNLRATAVLRLMTLAKESGKYLSDVILVTRIHLEKLSGNALFAYVRTLLQQDKDFAYIAKEQREKNNQNAVKHSQLGLVQRKLHEWIGRSFKNLSGTHNYLLGNDGFLTVSMNGKIIGSEKFSLKFVEAVQDHRLQIQAA